MFTSEMRKKALEDAISSVNALLKAGLGEPCIQLRMATQNDIAGCKNVHGAVLKEDFVEIGLDDIYQKQLENNDTNALIVAVAPDNTVVGTCCFSSSPTLGKIELINSLPSSRHEAPIGTALMCAVLGTLQNLNIKLASLDAQLAKFNKQENIKIFNEQLFNWYESKFQFEISDVTVNTLLETAGKNIKELPFLASVIEMSNFNLDILQLSDILNKAITDKITLQHKSISSSRPPAFLTSESARSSFSKKEPQSDTTTKSRKSWTEKISTALGIKKKH